MHALRTRIVLHYGHARGVKHSENTYVFLRMLLIVYGICSAATVLPRAPPSCFSLYLEKKYSSLCT